MSLQPCRTCGHQVAPTARACPSCGDRRPLAPAGEEGPSQLVTLLLALVVAGVAIAVLQVVWK